VKLLTGILNSYLTYLNYIECIKTKKKFINFGGSMYVDEKTSFDKLLICLNAGCATIFRVSGKILKATVKFLAGEANQNGRAKEVNS
jgi:hypothetical protein